MSVIVSIFLLDSIYVKDQNQKESTITFSIDLEDSLFLYLPNFDLVNLSFSITSDSIYGYNRYKSKVFSCAYLINDDKLFIKTDEFDLDFVKE